MRVEMLIVAAGLLTQLQIANLKLGDPAGYPVYLYH